MAQFQTATIEATPVERVGPSRTLTLDELIATGVRPKGVYVPVGEITVDSSYYRELHPINLDNMVATGFDPIAAGALIGNRRDDGMVYLIDGQHRWQCAIACGVASVLVALVEGLTVEEEATEYERTNIGRTDVTPAERFKAQLRRGYPPALALKRAVEEKGYTIAYDPSATGWTSGISAVRALQHLYELGDTALVSEVLELIRTAWRDGQGATEGVMLKAFGLFVTNHRADYLPGRLTSALLTMTPLDLRRRARTVQLELGSGGTVLNLYRALLAVYNDQRGKAGPRLVYKPRSFVNQRSNTRRRLSDEQIADLRTQAQAGKTTTDLAEAFGITERYVQRIKRGDERRTPLILQAADDQHRLPSGGGSFSFEEDSKDAPITP